MDADAEPVVLNGFAHAELAYPAPDLRHTHDLDLLVAEAGRVPAVLGCAPPTAFRHDNGTRVRLWRTPFPPPTPPSPAATVRLPAGSGSSSGAWRCGRAGGRGDPRVQGRPVLTRLGRRRLLHHRAPPGRLGSRSPVRLCRRHTARLDALVAAGIPGSAGTSAHAGAAGGAGGDDGCRPRRCAGDLAGGEAVSSCPAGSVTVTEEVVELELALAGHAGSRADRRAGAGGPHAAAVLAPRRKRSDRARRP